MKNIHLLMFLAMIAWGSNWISAKILMNYFNVYDLIFWRFFIAAIGLFFVIIFLKIPFRTNISSIFYAFLCSIILSFYNFFFFLGDHYGNAALGGVLVTTLNPAITFFALAIIYKKNLTFVEITALILGMVGTSLIIKIWQFNLDNKGVVFFLLAAFTWPLLTIVSSKIKKENSLVFSFFMFLFTSVIVFFAFLHAHIPTLNLDFKGYFNLFSLSLYGTTFATSAYFLGSSVLGGKRASAYIFIVPFSAVIFARIFLGEKIDLFVVIGGIISIIGIYILNGYTYKDLKVFFKKYKK